MPEVGSPLSGLSNNRNLSDEDLIRAIRFAASGEYEAAQTYIELAESKNYQLAAKVFKSVVDIKRKQMEDFQSFPYDISADEKKPYAKGTYDVEDGNQENAI